METFTCFHQILHRKDMNESSTLGTTSNLAVWSHGTAISANATPNIGHAERSQFICGISTSASSQSKLGTSKVEKIVGDPTKIDRRGYCNTYDKVLGCTPRFVPYYRGPLTPMAQLGRRLSFLPPFRHFLHFKVPSSSESHMHYRNLELASHETTNRDLESLKDTRASLGEILDRSPFPGSSA